MKRDKEYRVKPVKSIELSDKHIKPKVVILIASLLVFVGSMIALFYFLFRTESGWQNISISYGIVNSDKAISLNYKLGENGADPNVERRAIDANVKNTLVKSYELLDANNPYENMNNVHTLNESVNEEIVVDEFLYNSILEASNTYTFYLAPILQYYTSIINATNDSDARNFYPKTNNEIRQIFDEIAAYSNDRNHVKIIFSGNNKIKLYVSNEYLNFAKENDITNFIDFSWMRNAYILDYVSKGLIDSNLTNGYLTSADGYSVNLGVKEDMALNIYDYDNNVKNVGKISFNGKMNYLSLRNFILNKNDNKYIKYLDNDRITLFIDNLGNSSMASNYYVSMSNTKSLASLAINAEKVLIGSQIKKTELMTDANYYWLQNNKICYNKQDYKIEFLNGYEGELINA